MKREPVRCTVRMGKSGPPPHTSFTMCGEVFGDRVHVDGVTLVNTHDPLFVNVRDCDESCKGWIRVTDNACAWLEGIGARKARNEPMRGAI